MTPNEHPRNRLPHPGARVLPTRRIQRPQSQLDRSWTGVRRVELVSAIGRLANPKRVCSVRDCPKIYPRVDGSKCEKHRTESKQAHWAKTRAYSSKGHRSFRTQVLAREPLCAIDGLAQSTVADHYPLSRQDLVDSGLNPNDPQYGRGLCKQHHDQETALNQPGGWNNRN